MSIYDSSEGSQRRNPYGDDLSESIEDYYAERERKLREEK